MTESNVFRSPEDEVRQLAADIRELKDTVREILRKVNQIETRAKRAFPSAFPRSSEGKARRPSGKADDPPSMTPQQVLQLYDELVTQAQQGQRDIVQDRLRELELSNLTLLSRELGVSQGGKKPSRSSLIKGILGRLNESLMLSAQRQRVPASREGDTGEAGSSVSGTHAEVNE